MAENPKTKETVLKAAPKAGGKQPEIVDGLDKVMYARLLKDKDSQDGKRIYFQTESKFNEKGKSDSVTTKDGEVVTMKGIEGEVETSAYVTRFSDQYEWVVNAFHNHEKWELWFIDLKDEGTDTNAGKYKAMHVRALMTEFQDSMAAEDKEKLEMKFKMEGKPKFGYSRIPEEVEEVTTDYPFIEAVRNGGGD